MNHTDPKQYLASMHRAVAYGGAIEWEELPSLSEQLVRQQALPASGASVENPSATHGAWRDTEPSAFDAFAASAPLPLHEPFEGLGVREVSSAQVFQHFFGTPPQR